MIETNTFILSNVVIQIFGLTENEYALNIALAPLSIIYLVIIFKLITVVWRSKKAKLLNKIAWSLFLITMGPLSAVLFVWGGYRAFK